MWRPCCECQAHLVLQRKTRRGKDSHRLEIRSVEKADRGAAAVAAVVVDGEQNALPGCNVSWQCSSGMEGRTKGRGSIRNTWCH